MIAVALTLFFKTLFILDTLHTSQLNWLNKYRLFFCFRENILAENNPPLLPLQNMAERHQALTPSIANSYLEAARVCLDRHHISPKEFTLEDDRVEAITRVEWVATDDRTQKAWDRDDATEVGACALAIAAVELSRNMFAIRRAEKPTGADYYISLTNEDAEDLENCLRLEVSGTRSDKAEVRKRLPIKIDQTRRGNSNLPAIVAIVGFQVRLILLHTVDEAS
ncbi:MAG: hypothetical protein AAFY26_02990 [Cyanobacteria bacterium J06638_22]